MTVVLCVKQIRRMDCGKHFLGSVLPAVTQQINCRKQYPYSELNIKEEVIFRSFT